MINLTFLTVMLNAIVYNTIEYFHQKLKTRKGKKKHENGTQLRWSYYKDENTLTNYYSHKFMIILLIDLLKEERYNTFCDTLIFNDLSRFLFENGVKLLILMNAKFQVKLYYC